MPPIILIIHRIIILKIINVFNIFKNSAASFKFKDNYLYYGNLYPYEPQLHIKKFIGLALSTRHKKDVRHNVYDILPWPHNSTDKIQSQDIFEHLEFNKIIVTLD